MEVILRHDVDKIGKAGSVAKVKDGFARNFLFPNGLAVPCTSANLRKLESEKQKKLHDSENTRKEAEKLKIKLESLSLTMPVLVQEEDKFYGSIGASDIEKALKEEGLEVEKHFIELEEPIRALGIYEIPVRLHSEVMAKVKVWIVKK